MSHHTIPLTACAALMVAITLAGCGAAQRGETRRAHSNGATVPQREHAWADAMRSHNMAALDDILAAEFRLTFVDPAPERPGKPEVPRELWLDNLAQMTFGRVEMIGMHVEPLGERVAVARMRMVLHDWKWGEHAIPPKYDVTDVWVWRNDRWQVVNRISEPLEPPAPRSAEDQS